MKSAKSSTNKNNKKVYIVAATLIALVGVTAAIVYALGLNTENRSKASGGSVQMMDGRGLSQEEIDARKGKRESKKVQWTKPTPTTTNPGAGQQPQQPSTYTTRDKGLNQ